MGAGREHDVVGVHRAGVRGDAGPSGLVEKQGAGGSVQLDAVGEGIDVHPQLVGQPGGCGAVEQVLRQRRPVVRRHALGTEHVDVAVEPGRAQLGNGARGRQPGADHQDVTGGRVGAHRATVVCREGGTDGR